MLFRPQDQSSIPGIIVLSGSGGGLNEQTAALFASHGIAALALAYFHHEDLPEDLENIPLGSVLIALADIHDRLTSNVAPLQEAEEYGSRAGIEKLGGRAFPHVALYALHEAVPLMERSDH